MSRRGVGTTLQWVQSGWDTALFLLWCFLYAWLVVDPRLLHHAMGILTPYHNVCFKTGWPFLLEHLQRPGGTTEYIMRFLSMSHFYLGVGALILTGIAWALCGSSDALVRSVHQRREFVVRYLPVTLLLPVYGSYGNPLPAVLPLLVALLAFFLLRPLLLRGSLAAVGLLVVATFAVYWFAGVACLVFSLLVGVDALIQRRQKTLSCIAIACGLLVPWLVGSLILGLPLDEAYGKPQFNDARIGAWDSLPALLLWLYFPSLLLGAWLIRGLPQRQTARPRHRKRRSDKAELAQQEISWQLRRLLPAKGMWLTVACGLAGLFIWQTHSWSGKTSLLVDYLCQQRRWSAALDVAARTPTATSNARFHRNVMMALSQTGRLGDQMFQYPQPKSPAAYDLLDPARDSHTHFQDSRFFFELGHLNLAEKAAYEALSATAEWPPLLHHLALIHIAKGQPEAARVHLNAMRQHLFRRTLADELLAKLDTDPSLDGDPVVHRVRSCTPKLDRPTVNADMDETFRALLTANPKNRMAFEFLQAHYLCDLRPDQVVKNLDLLELLGYAEVPRAYQEAIIVDANRNGLPIPKSDARLDAETISRAEQFFSVLAGASNPQQAAESSRRLGLGDSYFMFYCFGVSGP